MTAPDSFVIWLAIFQLWLLVAGLIVGGFAGYVVGSKRAAKRQKGNP